MMNTEDKKKNHPQEEPKPETPEARTSDSVPLDRAEFEALQKKLRDLEGLKENLLRSAADFENAKKRLVRERDEFAKFALEKLIRNLLPVIDGMERALGHADPGNQAQFKNVLTGIQLVVKQFQDLLKQEGLTRLAPQGEIFDPHLHEAVLFVREDGKENEILEEIEAGYLLHDRLLRPAKVKVRISPTTPSQPATDEKEDEIT